MELVQSILSFVVAILILVTLHELGHFYVARLCGVKVLRFSVGFGKPLFRWVDKHGTEFCLAPIPLGGYVKMLDEREGEVPPELLDQAFTQKGVWQRIAIVAAGPIANFLLAILLYWVIFLPGVTALTPVVGKVDVGGLAAVAGIESGQQIIAVDGEPTATRRELFEALLGRLGETGQLILTVSYSGSDLEYETVVELKDWLKETDVPDPIAGLGFSLYQPELKEIIVAQLVANEPASQAGILVGDKLLRVDGVVIDGWQSWSDYVRARPGQNIEFEVLRDGQQVSLSVTPRARLNEQGEASGFVGIGPEPTVWPEEMLQHYDYGIVGSFGKAAEVTWVTSKGVLVNVKKLIVGEISTKNLSGPITIAKVAGERAEHGILSFIEFLAMISVFLGVFNLLPIPVLDGGHLLYYFIEVLKGTPVSEKSQMFGYQLGMVLVLSLMTLAFYNDIMRL